MAKLYISINNYCQHQQNANADKESVTKLIRQKKFVKQFRELVLGSRETTDGAVPHDLELDLWPN